MPIVAASPPAKTISKNPETAPISAYSIPPSIF